MAKSRVTGKVSLKQKIREALRAVFTRHHVPRREVLAEARRLQPRTKKDGEEAKQPAVFYKCAECAEMYKATEVHVDHIEPVGATPEWPAENDGDWERWMYRLLCANENLRVLCVQCHLIKSNQEKRNAALQGRRNDAATKKGATRRPRVVGKKLAHK